MIEARISSIIAPPQFTRMEIDGAERVVEETRSLIVNIMVPFDNQRSLGWAAGALARICEDCLVVCPIHEVIDKVNKDYLDYQGVSRFGNSVDVAVGARIEDKNVNFTFQATGLRNVYAAPGYLHERNCNAAK